MKRMVPFPDAEAGLDHRTEPSFYACGVRGPIGIEPWRITAGTWNCTGNRRVAVTVFSAANGRISVRWSRPGRLGIGIRWSRCATWNEAVATELDEESCCRILRAVPTAQFPRWRDER